MEKLSVRQGSALARVVTLKDAAGKPVTAANGYPGYTGAEALACKVWPGDNRAPVAEPSATWKDASKAEVLVELAGDDSATIEAGGYPLALTIADGGEPYTCWEALLTILPGPGSEPAPKVLCSLSDIQVHGRAWVAKLQTDGDQSGFIEQRGLARDWFLDIVHARHPRRGRQGLGMNVFGRAVGGWGSGSGRDPWLVELIEADQLLVTPRIREANAMYALGLIARGQVAVESKVNWRMLAGDLFGEAESIASGLVVEFANGHAIDLGHVRTRWA